MVSKKELYSRLVKDYCKLVSFETNKLFKWQYNNDETTNRIIIESQGINKAFRRNLLFWINWLNDVTTLHVHRFGSHGWSSPPLGRSNVSIGNFFNAWTNASITTDLKLNGTDINQLRYSMEQIHGHQHWRCTCNCNYNPCHSRHWCNCHGMW